MKRFWDEEFKQMINKMLEYAGYNDIDFDFIIKNQEQDWVLWYHWLYWTIEQENNFRSWASNYLKQYIPKIRIEKEISLFLLNYWLIDKELFLRKQKEKNEDNDKVNN